MTLTSQLGQVIFLNDTEIFKAEQNYITLESHTKFQSLLYITRNNFIFFYNNNYEYPVQTYLNRANEQ